MQKDKFYSWSGTKEQFDRLVRPCNCNSYPDTKTAKIASVLSEMVNELDNNFYYASEEKQVLRKYAIEISKIL